MKSIRLSLILYFLTVIALTLAAVLGLLYQTIDQTLEAKRRNTRELLLARAEIRRDAVRENFQTELLHRAQGVAALVQLQSARLPREYYPLGVLSGALAPSGYVVVPAWVAEGVEGPLARAVQFQSLVDLQPSPGGHRAGEAGRADHDEIPAGEYFQLSSSRGERLRRSASLGARWLPLTEEMRRVSLLDSRYDDTDLSPGVPIGIVTLKAPVTRLRFRRSAANPPPVSPPRPPAVQDRPIPAVFVQYAKETCERDAELAGIDHKLQQELADHDVIAAQTLTSLRRRLAWIGLATFVTAVAGCCALIGLGLVPLRRLSEAVSHVSEKDFRLPFNPRDLPLELRPIYDRLSMTLKQLERAFAREKQAAADISHELRTPLAALMTTIEVTLRKPRDTAHYIECLAECSAIGQQMTQMVERLLTLARLDAGADHLQPQEVDAGEVAEQSVALVRPLADARGLDLSMARQGPAVLTTDPDKLREVIVNLLHNAVEYNRPKGRVQVRVARENGHVELDVSDTGIGISPEARERIFERFYRADSSRQADTIHAGVGLSIVKGYVDLMGGRVWVDSTPGQGTTFHVRLPSKTAT